MENHGRQKEEKERREEPVFSFLFRSFYPKFKISCPHMFTCFYPLTARGVEDILTAVTDGLKGMMEAVEAVFPQDLHHASTSFVAQMIW